MTRDIPPEPLAAANVPPNGRALQPILWSTIERWQAAATPGGDWEGARQRVPLRHEDWAGMVELLQLINAFQWHEEDRSRDPQAEDATLVAVKRSIDASNRRRVRLVEELDALLHERLAAAGLLSSDAPLHSESPGSIVDRLTVLALKIFHVRAALTAARQIPAEGGSGAGTGAAGTEAPMDPQLTELYERLRGLTEQMVDLTGCLDRLLADIYAGRVRFKLYRQVKVYRDPVSGQMRRE
jgi:hypothetical protein